MQPNQQSHMGTKYKYDNVKKMPFFCMSREKMVNVKHKWAEWKWKNYKLGRVNLK